MSSSIRTLHGHWRSVNYNPHDALSVPCSSHGSRGREGQIKNGRFPHSPLRHLKMVAPCGAMSDSESCSSSNSDAEELERCREAAMPAWGLEQCPQWAEKPKTGRGLSEERGSSHGPWKGWMVGRSRGVFLKLLRPIGDQIHAEGDSFIPAEAAEGPKCLLTAFF